MSESKLHNCKPSSGPVAKRRAVGSRTVSVLPNTLIPGEVVWVEECHALMLDAVWETAIGFLEGIADVTECVGESW